MQFFKGLCLFGLSFGVVFCAVCFANADVSFVSNPIWLSTSKTTEGTAVQVSTVVTKQGTETISGTVTFYADGDVIGTSDFALPADVGGVVVTATFTPETGTHTLSAKITRAIAVRGDTEEVMTTTSEVKVGEPLVVESDNDRDGIPDASDPDDDNDGVSDADERAQGTDPLKKEATPAVAGTSMASFSGATDAAKNVGAVIFEKTEALRESAANYFDTKLKDAEAARDAKRDAADDFLEEDIEEKLVADPKPLSEQLQDTSGMFEGLKIQAYKALLFVFDNIFVFYFLSIVIILWIVRKIWRRHSLD
ncbi:MAG TPA: Ig-like domain-containing protein [Candidatus Paceibacterota bacterium]|nr:Ig-like domain-containing protein [Candidatus Paceibacterota bacterium]